MFYTTGAQETVGVCAQAMASGAGVGAGAGVGCRGPGPGCRGRLNLIMTMRVVKLCILSHSFLEFLHKKLGQLSRKNQKNSIPLFAAMAKRELFVAGC